MIYKKAANCKITKGFKRSLLIDFTTNDTFAISNEFASLIESPIAVSDNTDKDLLYAIQKLVEKDLIFSIPDTDIDNFIEISNTFNTPSIIYDSIIEIGNNLNIEKLIFELELLSCKNIEFRFLLNPASINHLSIIDSILQLTEQSTLENIDFHLPFLIYNLNVNKFDVLIQKYVRVRNLLVYNTPLDYPSRNGNLFFLNENLNSNIHCGNIGELYFLPNLKLFNESQHHNTCLNRKISIDSEGNIKNCPSMAKSYGNIKDTKLIDVVNNPEFQKVWHVKKDEITKCKDCEFRHICTDCRAYIENPEDQYSAPLKCGYNPYTCEWEEWNSNPLKQKAIEYYGMQELVKK